MTLDVKYFKVRVKMSSVYPTGSYTHEETVWAKNEYVAVGRVCAMRHFNDEFDNIEVEEVDLD